MAKRAEAPAHLWKVVLTLLVTNMVVGEQRQRRISVRERYAARHDGIFQPGTVEDKLVKSAEHRSRRARANAIETLRLERRYFVGCWWRSHMQCIDSYICLTRWWGGNRSRLSPVSTAAVTPVLAGCFARVTSISLQTGFTVPLEIGGPSVVDEEQKRQCCCRFDCPGAVMG